MHARTREFDKSSVSLTRDTHEFPESFDDEAAGYSHNIFLRSMQGFVF